MCILILLKKIENEFFSNKSKLNIFITLHILAGTPLEASGNTQGKEGRG